MVNAVGLPPQGHPPAALSDWVGGVTRTRLVDARVATSVTLAGFSVPEWRRV